MPFDATDTAILDRVSGKGALVAMLTEAWAELRTAERQMLPADDQIICERVRTALALVKCARDLIAAAERA